MSRIRWALLAGASLSLGCAAPVQQTRHMANVPAVAALREGSFDRAAQLAREGIQADAADPYARIVRAIVRYEKTMHQLALDGRTTLVGGFEAGAINQKYLRTTFGDAEAELAAVEEDLAAASRERGIALELCLACWEIDWNGNGRVDERDRRLFEIEQDADGNPIPEGDPRRRPTFRFDDGDIPWARAFVSFQRAALDVVLAYDWTEVAGLARRRRDRPDRVVVRLVDPGRIAEAKKRLLEGLGHSDACRRAYLAETDDDREWVPSPRQKNHPMPLPVDQALYDTWEGVIGDVRRLAHGDEGLKIADVLALTGEHVEDAPRGYLDVGRMLAHPKDIVIDLRALHDLLRDDDVEGATKSLLGEYYFREMKASPLPQRLLRMKGEIDRQEEGFERKLRYLFWLN